MVVDAMDDAEDRVGRQGGQPPDWFFDARDRLRDELRPDSGSTGRLVSASAAPGDGPLSDPRPGEIRAVRVPGDDGEAQLRLVLVRYVDAGRRWASVALISDHIRMAGDADVELTPVRSGLAYRVMVQTDLVGPVWLSQLDESVGRVSAETLAGINEAEATGRPSVSRAWCGLPIVDDADPRRGFKRLEVRRLEALTAACRSELSRDSGAVRAEDRRQDAREQSGEDGR